MQPQCFLNRDRKLYSDVGADVMIRGGMVSLVPSPFSPPTALRSVISSVDATVDYNTLATISLALPPLSQGGKGLVTL